MSVTTSPAPGDPTHPPPGRREVGHALARLVVGLFAVLGAVGSVITIYTYLAPPAGEQRIIDVSADLPLAYRSRTFPMEETVAGVAVGNEDLLQSEVTFWRDGGKPITADMTRKPLRIYLPSGSHLVAFKVVGVESSVPDNFTVERAGDDLLVRWKVFDPDMALKVALVRSGSSAGLKVSAEVGPGVRLTGSRYTAAKAFGIGAFMVVLTLGLIVLFLVALACFLVLSDKWDKRIRHARARNVIALSVIVGLVALTYQGFQYEAQFVSWVAARAVKPIPLQ